MLVLTLIMQIKEFFGCDWASLCKFTCPSCMEVTWNRFFVHAEKWMKKKSPEVEALSLQKYWYYARSFRGTVFPELSFMHNQYACKIFAILLDKIQDPETGYHKHGDIYEGLIGQRSKIARSGPADFFSAEEMYHDLMINFVLTASGAEGKSQMQRVKTRLDQLRAQEAPALELSSEEQARLLAEDK